MKKTAIEILDEVITKSHYFQSTYKKARYWNDGVDEEYIIAAMEAYAVQQVADGRVVSFETEYQLEQFREIQKDHFDEDGKAYRHLISTHLCERMLTLINQFEAELTAKPEK